MAEQLEKFTNEIDEISKDEDEKTLKKNLDKNLKSALEKVW